MAARPKKAVTPEKKLQAATKKLQPYLADNAPSSLSISDGAIHVIEPWDDPTLAFKIPEKNAPLIKALNGIRLPKRLSAVWHRATSDLEVIWTAYNLSASQMELASRKFSFKYKSKSFVCEFSDSSSTVITLGDHLVPLLQSPTNFRNLLDVMQFMRMPEEIKKRAGFDKPRSFWIRNIGWDEERINDLVANLNFYLTYYDDRSPQILLHDPREKDQIALKTRYLHGPFPEEIEARELDTNLLSFWNAADRGEPSMRFLLYFRIIEYATTHYVDNSVRSELRKILMAPNLKANIQSALDSIVSSVGITKIEDVQRFKALIRHCVDPKLIWKEVKANQAFFSKDTKFDGGFTVKALVSSADSEETYCTRGLESFSESVRKIRNALAHGKDQETAGVITPTTRNLKLFLPWVHLIATAAGEVVLYKDAT